MCFAWEVDVCFVLRFLHERFLTYLALQFRFDVNFFPLKTSNLIDKHHPFNQSNSSYKWALNRRWLIQCRMRIQAVLQSDNRSCKKLIKMVDVFKNTQRNYLTKQNFKLWLKTRTSCNGMMWRFMILRVINNLNNKINVSCVAPIKIKILAV